MSKKPVWDLFGKELDFLIVTNVQSNSISVIDKTTHNLIKNSKSRRLAILSMTSQNHLYVTNQRSNSISIIDMHDYKNIQTKNEICEYPEGIDML